MAVSTAHHQLQSRKWVGKDFDDIEEQIQTVISKYPGSPTIIAGDFNADRSTNPAGAERLEKLTSYGLKIMIDVPTFHRGTTRSVLDNILLSDSLANADLRPQHTVQQCDYTSHHQKVTMKMHVTRVRAKTAYKTGRCWRTLCNTDLLADLQNVNWNQEVPRSWTCEDQWTAFSAIFWSILDTHVPVRRMKIHNPKPPPLSDETIELVADRRIAKATKDEERYHQLNMQAKRAIRKDLRDDISNRIQQAGPSRMWQQLRPIIAPRKQQQTVPDRLSADELNSYFVSVGTDTKSSVMRDFSASGRHPLNIQLPRVHTDALNFVPVTLPELERVISEMPNKLSIIEDDIPIHVLKLSFPVIGRLLLHIINCSIVSETVPSSWKKATVVPLHKKGDAAQASNYRPITNVPIMCKIIEKIIYKQLSSYMERNHLYSEDQHGFRPGHSTTTALLTVTDSILTGMDSSEVSLMTLIDLSRCFDVIDHNALLGKLRQLQVSTGWLESYLGGHVQRVRVNGTTSEPRDITVGTFQGSSLGPLLFNIMANDLSTYIPATIDGFRVTVTRYADDTQIVPTGPRNQLAEMQSSMSSVLDGMLTWFLQHGMKVNTKKTELLLIGGPRMLPKPEDVTPISVQFNGETIHESQSGYVRNLGVTMDKNLNWVKHIDKTVAKCCGILIGLASAKNVLPLNVLPRLIDALVFSHLRYCVQVYGNASNCHLRKIQKVFKGTNPA